jgi:hypothetical protein
MRCGSCEHDARLVCMDGPVFALAGVDLIVTSLPYNIDIAYGTHDDALSYSSQAVTATCSSPTWGTAG